MRIFFQAVLNGLLIGALMVVTSYAGNEQLQTYDAMIITMILGNLLVVVQLCFNQNGR